MADMEKELQAAFEAQQRRKANLEKSVDELRQVAAQGSQAGSGVRKLLWAAGGTVFLVLSAILLADPKSRIWFWPLLFTVLAAGAWSYYRNTRG